MHHRPDPGPHHRRLLHHHDAAPRRPPRRSAASSCSRAPRSSTSTLQVPVLDAVIARKPDAILIAPTDKVQLVAPLKKANDAGIPVITRRHLHRHRQVPDRRGRCRLPALLHRLRQRPRRPHRGARARQGDRRQGQGLRLQREARHLDHRPARGRLQGRDEELPGHQGARDPVQRRRRQQGGGAAPGGLRPHARPRRRVRRQPVLGDRRRQRRQAGRQERQDQGRRLRRADNRSSQT